MLRRDLLEWIVAVVASAVGRDGDDQRRRAGDRRETAVVDRVEDGRAVVLFEADEGTRPRQETVPAPVLPPPAREEGTVIRVPDGDGFALAEVDRAATRERRADGEERLNDLAESDET